MRKISMHDGTPYCNKTKMTVVRKFFELAIRLDIYRRVISVVTKLLYIFYKVLKHLKDV